jgi:protein-S-isoprenylcysteine O-methyltransferase Ste14
MKISQRLRDLFVKDQINVLSLVYVGAIILLMLINNISYTPDRIFLILTFFAIILGRGKIFLRDWIPFLTLFLGYEIMRGFADIFHRASYNFLINSEKILTGTIPTIELQKILYKPGVVSWYDNFGVLLYFTHFVNPLLIAFVLWLKNRKLYFKFITGLLLLSYLSFVIFILFPTVPPWMAARDGYLPHVDKIIDQTLVKNNINYSISFFYKNLNPNPVAAFPSLHAAFPWFITLVLAQISPFLTLIFFAVSLLIGFFIVYLGEHYVVDALFGVVMATVVYGAVYHYKKIINLAKIKNFILFFLVSAVFITNILILIGAKENLGFGNIYVAVFGLILFVLGIVIWFLGYATLGSSFSLLPRAKKIVKNGIYGYLKHPIYTGMIFSFAGLSIAKGTWLGFFFTVLVTGTLNYFRAKHEEKILNEKFG